jgi:hypothetical protein
MISGRARTASAARARISVSRGERPFGGDATVHDDAAERIASRDRLDGVRAQIGSADVSCSMLPP